MSTESIYAGASQADVASLTTNGITFECSVWLAGATGAREGTRVEAKVFALGEGGQRVLVDAAVVATPAGDYVDCPRVLAASSADDSLFVVHWIDVDENEGSHALHRALFDVTDIAAGWAPQGSVSLYETLQYDHAEVVGASDGGFVIARRTAADTISITRFASPWTWIAVDWGPTNIAGLIIDDTILGCYAHEADNTLLISYQSALTLRTISRTASGGNAVGNEETLGTIDSETEHVYTLVRHARISEDDYIVAVETRPSSVPAGYGDYLRRVAWRQIRRDAAAVFQPQWQWNLGLHSLWSWASGTVGITEVYAAVTFKSIDDGQEFDQQYAYVVRLDVAALATAPAGTIRPVPCAAIMSGAFDARPHGASPFSSADVSIGARLNHSSRAVGPPQYALGQGIKTKTFACTMWGRLVAVSDEPTELHPAEAGIGLVSFDHEPPWTVRRDPSEPTQPDTPAWTGVSKAMCLPLETPAGLALSGGCTQAYDGEQLVELGYLWAPEIVDLQVTSMGGAGDMGGLEYHWYVNYVWPDNRGGIHRGGPSRPVSAVLENGEFATLTVRCAYSLKDDRTRYPTCAPIAIEVWRTYAVTGSLVTDPVGTYLFRSEYGENDPSSSFEIRDTPNSDPNAPTVDIVVGRANALVDGNQLAPYQLNLDTLQWVPPPPTPHQPLGPMTLWKNRLAGVDPERGVFKWSEAILPLGNRYEWPRFLDTNELHLDGVGKVTACATLDYAAVLWTRDGTFSVTGEPGAGGAGISVDAQTISRGIGCIEQRSVVVTHVGVFFQSAKGIHMLDRGLAVQYPGAPVEDLVRRAGNLRGAAHIEDRHLVVWALQEEPGTGPLRINSSLLAYDYSTDRWSLWVYPGFGSASTASRLNENMHLAAWHGRAGGQVIAILHQGGLAIERSAADTVFADEGAAATVAIPMTVQTEWLLLTRASGLYRVREFGIVTTRLNPGGMQAQIYFDRTGAFDEDQTPQSVSWASPAPAYLPIRPRDQRISAAMLVISELNPGLTENLTITELMVRWQPKPTPRRAASGTIGT